MLFVLEERRKWYLFFSEHFYLHIYFIVLPIDFQLMMCYISKRKLCAFLILLSFNIFSFQIFIFVQFVMFSQSKHPGCRVSFSRFGNNKSPRAFIESITVISNYEEFQLIESAKEANEAQSLADELISQDDLLIAHVGWNFVEHVIK